MRILAQILPRQVDNRFDGHLASLWLFGFFIALKLAMGVNSILNTASVAAGADGIALATFSPAAVREILALFALTSLGQMTLALIALTALIRYRALVPFMYLVLLIEALARRLIVQSYDLTRTATASAGFYINIGIIVLLAAGLVLSLTARRRLPKNESSGNGPAHL